MREEAPRIACLVGLVVSFVVAIDLIRAIRVPLLLDQDPLWALPRLGLGLAVVAVAATAGGAAAGAFFLWSRSRAARTEPQALPISDGALLALALGAIVAGAFLRFVALERVPPALWIDDVSLIAPALALEGSWRDFADSIRPAPFGVEKPYGTVGVLYLEAHRLALQVSGVTVWGVRFLAALAGVLSLATAALIGRTLLPRGGGALVALALAGLRWHLILSRWGWVAMTLVPVADAAALLVLRARSRRSLATAAIAGFVMGLGAHIYLSAWIAGVALLALVLWPAESGWRFPLAVVYILGFLLSVAPLFLFRENRTAPYFTRVNDLNVFNEMTRSRSLLPPLSAAADSLAAPWFLSDPMPLHDLSGRSRLGWILGIPLAISLARSLLFPREELSGYLLSQAGAAIAASVAGGQAGLPNGFRFAYLTTAAAVAGAGGILWLLGLILPGRRALAACAALGLVAFSGVLGARDALVIWGESRTTFDYFHGPDTLLARAALRWERYGRVKADLSLAHSPITFDAVRGFRLDPDERLSPRRRPAGSGRVREFRIVAPDSAPRARERVVERVRDAWGRDWGIVFGQAEPEP